MSTAVIPCIIDRIKRGEKGKRVREVQEWLCLHDFHVEIDGDFGPATELAVTRFQQAKGLSANGVVTPETFAALVQPLREVVAPINAAGKLLGQLVSAYAAQHLRQHPREAGKENCGPWVRLYMEGSEGNAYPWCAGFACYVLKQACEALGKEPPIKLTFSCDELARSAKKKGIFLSAPNESKRSLIRAGALFLRRQTDNDWVHTGIVIKVNNNNFDTIEGNTNHDASNNGYEVNAQNHKFGSYDFVLL